VQENVENPQETARRQASTNASWSSESSIAGWPHAENSRATLWTYSSSFDSAFSSRPAILRIAISGFALAKRTLGFGLGRPLLSLSSKRLGLVCDGGQAVPSKSSRLPRSGAPAGRENMQGWSQAFTTIPASIHRRIRASVSDEISGIIRLGTGQGWIVQLCHFHLISRLQNCRGQRNRRLQGRPLREALYQHVRQALELPDGPRLQTVLKKLRHLVRQATGLRVMRMIVREFLRRIDHFRAYRKYPELDLPTTTGSVEAMNRRVRDLMRQTRNIKSPQALHLWATALIRTRPMVMCNGKHFSTK
jgi:diadenosine tetraphosphate (Ap4A) HIT family hydrolase